MEKFSKIEYPNFPFLCIIVAFMETLVVVSMYSYKMYSREGHKRGGVNFVVKMASKLFVQLHQCFPVYL